MICTYYKKCSVTPLGTEPVPFFVAEPQMRGVLGQQYHSGTAANKRQLSAAFFGSTPNFTPCHHEALTHWKHELPATSDAGLSGKEDGIPCK
jgi:hypothetical protein